MDVKTAHPAQNILGEGPIWHAESGSVFWIDIENKELFELHLASNTVKSWRLPSRVGTIAIDNENHLILALTGGLARFDLRNYSLQNLVDLEKNIENNRPNDGKVGPDGRLWQGTMNVDCEDGHGALYSIDSELGTQQHLTGLSVSNGMAWSHDYRFFYHIDSPTYSVKKYTFNKENGEISFDKIAINIPKEMGQPDGMTIDEEGMLWVAIWGGFAVQRWNPIEGNLLETIHLPAPQITSCTFGGENLDHLFITSARAGMSEADLKKYPESGNLFVKKINVKGLNPFKFGG